MPAISTAHGRLRHLLLCYPENAPSHPRYREVYEALLAGLGESLRVTIVAHPGSVGDVQGLIASNFGGRAEIVTAPAELEFSVWAQDPYVAIRDGDGGTSLLQPVEFPREADDGIAEVLARSTSIRVARSALWFQGGDMLVGDDFILVGRDSLEGTLTRLSPPGGPAAAQEGTVAFGASLFSEAFDPGRRIVFVGTDLPVPKPRQRQVVADGHERLEILHEGVGRTQPLFHIDLFISLAGRGSSGRYRLLVGSPRLADEILRRPSSELATPELFDDIAERLELEGFEVIRNPLPLTYADGRRVVDGAERDVRKWYFATANNCLIQIDDEAGNHVWLPTYGHRGWRDLKATDDANKVIWEGLGFTVHELPSFHAFAQKFGALACITKCLER